MKLATFTRATVKALVVPMFLFNAGIALAIDAPGNPRGSVQSPTQVQWEWDWVSGVAKYEVTVDGQSKGLTPDPRFTSRDLWAGEHSMSVKAVDYNGQYSNQSVTVTVNTNNTNRPTRQPTDNATASSGNVSVPTNTAATQVEQSTVIWQWGSTAGAVSYEITVDGAFAGTTSDTQFYSRNLWVGEHSMTVKAINDSGQESEPSITQIINVQASYDDSVASSPVVDDSTEDNNPTPSTDTSSGNVSVPANTTANQVEQTTVQWQWDWTAGAASYEVTVDGALVGITSDTQFYSQNLWVGEHSMTVKAINDSGQASESSTTLKINVQASYDDSVAPPPVEDDSSEDNIPTPSTDTGKIDPASYAYNEIYQKDGYELVFSDEFNNSTLNSTRWNTQLRWDGEFNGERDEYRVINSENQFYVNIFSDNQDHQNYVVSQHNPFELDGSRLAIRAIKNPLKTTDGTLDHGDLYAMVQQQEFLSGAMSTYDKFTQKYGYFEARIKIPSHVGTFPAFWLHHQKQQNEGTQRTEIDIMENLGHAPWYIYNSFHYFTNVSETYGGEGQHIKPQPEGQIYTGADFSQNYHTYAVEWEPGHITWLIDGQKVSEVYNEHSDFEDLYIILNLAIGGLWTNYPANSGGLGRDSNDFYPNQSDLDNFSNPALEIDYVRAYERK